MIRDLLYERPGLMFEDKKRVFLEPRVVRRALARGCDDPREYFRFLKYNDEDGREFQALVEQVTTNETYFFRDYPQLECFANEVLRKVTDAKRAAGDFTLNIWCSACSTGDEAYTLAIILHACLDDFPRWKIRLEATDIDDGVLTTARGALYGDRNVKDVAPGYLREYFTQSFAGYRVADHIRQMVSFDHLNLMDKQKMRKRRGFDFIFCRNALIYFDEGSRKQVLGNFYDSLSPGGFVFLGHAESVGRISSAYEPVLIGGCVVYRKPEAPRSVKGRNP